MDRHMRQPLTPQAPTELANVLRNRRMTWSEIGFVVFVLLALCAVGLTGRMAYREAALFQQAKNHGVALLRWAGEEAAAHEAPDGAQRPWCAVHLGEAPASAAAAPNGPVNWGACRAQLFSAQGVLAGVSNPFGSQAPVLSQACERGHYAARGTLVVEKGTPSPPGFPPSLSYGPLDDAEPMVKGLMLRILVCDPSGYGVRVGEVKL